MAALLLVTLLAAGRLQEADQLCGHCQTTGRLANEALAEALEDEGEVVLQCSEIAGDEDLHHGVPFTPCERCKAPSLAARAREEYDRKVAAQKQWLHQVQEVDRFIADRQLRLMHCRTAHFDIAWAIRRVKIGRQVLDQHTSMHLYAERMEQAYHDYLELFGLTHDRDQNGVRHRLIVFERAKHCVKANPEYTGIGTPNSVGSKRLGLVSVFVSWWDKSENRTDDELHEYLMHNVVHLFLCSYGNYDWLAPKYGWVDAGLAHYFTERRFGVARTHCYQEQDETWRWIFADWRPAVRKRVAAGKVPIFFDVAVKHTQMLNAEEHLFVWSWVQFLVDAHEPRQFVRFVQVLKERRPVREALREAYDLSPFEFVERWREYVLETYPPR